MEKTVNLSNPQELDETDLATLDQAQKLTEEEFILMQMWYLQHQDGLDGIINNIEKRNNDFIYIDIFDANNNETVLAIVQTDSEYIDLNVLAEENDGYDQYKYYPFRDDATKCELVNWFYYAALESNVHPKLIPAKQRVQDALKGLLAVPYI